MFVYGIRAYKPCAVGGIVFIVFFSIECYLWNKIIYQINCQCAKVLQFIFISGKLIKNSLSSDWTLYFRFILFDYEFFSITGNLNWLIGIAFFSNVVVKQFHYKFKYIPVFTCVCFKTRTYMILKIVSCSLQVGVAMDEF